MIVVVLGQHETGGRHNLQHAIHRRAKRAVGLQRRHQRWPLRQRHGKRVDIAGLAQLAVHGNAGGRERLRLSGIVVGLLLVCFREAADHEWPYCRATPHRRAAAARRRQAEHRRRSARRASPCPYPARRSRRLDWSRRSSATRESAGSGDRHSLSGLPTRGEQIRNLRRRSRRPTFRRDHASSSVSAPCNLPLMPRSDRPANSPVLQPSTSLPDCPLAAKPGNTVLPFAGGLGVRGFAAERNPLT